MNAALLLLGAPTVWMIHLAVSYFLVVLDCSTSWNGGHAAVLVATLVCVGATGWTGVYAWREWQRTRRARRADMLEAADVREFLAVAGAGLSILFTGAVALTALSPLFLPTCS